MGYKSQAGRYTEKSQLFVGGPGVLPAVASAGEKLNVGASASCILVSYFCRSVIFRLSFCLFGRKLFFRAKLNVKEP